MISLLLSLGLIVAPQTPVEPQLVLTGVGRFAVFADMASITPDADAIWPAHFERVLSILTARPADE